MAQQTASQLLPKTGKCLSSCVLSAQIAAHPQEGDFVEGGLVISCETSLCFYAGQNKSAQYDVFCRRGAAVLLVRASGNTRI